MHPFVGAGSIKAVRSAGTSGIAHEIKASGRDRDVKELVNKIRSSDCKLIVIHGESGVGKSSVLEAGLVPALKQTLVKTPDKPLEVFPVLVRNYGDWKQAVKEKSGFEDDIFDSLKKNSEEKNLLTVLIFDQFEEFFFSSPELSKRIEFYRFVQDCLDVKKVSNVKVILSLPVLKHVILTNR